MRKSGGGPRVRAYVWRDGGVSTSGAMVDVPRSGRMVFIAQADLARVADRLVDVLEELEADGGGS